MLYNTCYITCVIFVWLIFQQLAFFIRLIQVFGGHVVDGDIVVIDLACYPRGVDRMKRFDRIASQGLNQSAIYFADVPEGRQAVAADRYIIELAGRVPAPPIWRRISARRAVCVPDDLTARVPVNEFRNHFYAGCVHTDRRRAGHLRPWRKPRRVRGQRRDY